MGQPNTTNERRTQNERRSYRLTGLEAYDQADQLLEDSITLAGLRDALESGNGVRSLRF
jgi:hypothetical protein